MTILDALLAFAVVAGLLTLVPGLDTALVLKASLTGSRRYAWATAAGIAAGAMAWGVAAAVGVSALLSASETAYRVLTVAGAVYMCYLGGSMIWRSFRGRGLAVPPADFDTPTDLAPWRGGLIGIGTNLLNPKVGVFYIATIPQFLPEGVPALPMGAALAGVHGLLTLAWFGILITAGSFARRRLASPVTLRVIDRVTGLFLVGFGGRLFFAGHNI
ncbi:LysE family translocator [Dietzia alimentaria]|uniref:LysE family translocator n=1 Tax=Dietzia alimentaria TaxID=665550 RepID=UPI00029A2E09|nr:LysE family translocator [Dietzia alimentaria]